MPETNRCCDDACGYVVLAVDIDLRVSRRRNGPETREDERESWSERSGKIGAGGMDTHSVQNARACLVFVIKTESCVTARPWPALLSERSVD